MMTEKTFEGCDFGGKSDRSVWSVFDPNDLSRHIDISREEFERLYLVQWVGGSQKVERFQLNDRPFSHIFT